MNRQMQSARNSTHRSAIAGVVVATVLSLGIAAVRAESPPPDTATIKSLTPEQARKLAADFPGADNEWSMGCLPLNGLTTLDAATAEALTGYVKGPLLLDGLTTLDIPTAKALAQFKSHGLWLNGLTTLDASAAAALAGFKGGTPPGATDVKLLLNGLKQLDAATAKSLAAYMGRRLFLNGLTAIDVDTAQALAACKCELLSLNGLTTLEAASARALAAFNGQGLWFGGLAALDAAAAKELATFKGQYLIVGLKELDPETCRALAGFNRAPGRSLICSEVLTRISADTVKAFVDSAMPLHLPALTALDAAAAEAMVAWEGWDGFLPGITALDAADSVAVAKALASFKRPLALPNLVKISPRALLTLLEKEDVLMPLLENLELIPEPDGSGTDDFVIPEGLEERQLLRHEQMREHFGLGE